MKIEIRADSVVVEGYVNAVERNSKPLISRIGKFIERIKKGAFKRAIERNDEIRVLLNHDWDRVLGSTKDNLKLHEDSIGLYARATITDREVIEDARNGNLVGWSFGFKDVPDGVEQRMEDEMPIRLVNDMDLREVSILNRKKSPAYEGTLILARDDGDYEFHGDNFEDEIEMVEVSAEIEERADESGSQQANGGEQPVEIEKEEIDYSQYEQMISEMKGEKEK